MSLILTSMALGLIPAWRASVMGILVCAWGVAGVIFASLLFGQGEIVNLLPALGLVILGFNGGIAMGMGIHFAATLRPSPTA